MFFMGILKNLTDEYFGKIERMEDTREFIDFGGKTTVLWAKYSLEIDGKSKFYFDDVKDFNKGGWRLPTIKEVKQIFKLEFHAGCWKNGYSVIRFTKGIELNVKMDSSVGGFHMWTKDEDNRFKFSRAWVYGFDSMYKFDFGSYDTSYNKCRVLLVKDKNKK